MTQMTQYCPLVAVAVSAAILFLCVTLTLIGG